MQVNKVNFLRWSDALEDPGLPEPPYAYWRQRNMCILKPIFLPGETNAFYINNPSGFIYPNFQDLRLQLINMENTIVSDGFAELQQHFLPEFAAENRYNIWADYVIPFIANEGDYKLSIIVGATGVVLLTSNIVKVRKDQSRLYDTTTFCRFRHDRFFYNIRYHDVPIFYQKFRLPISKLEEQISGTTEIHKQATTGRSIILESIEDKEVKFESYWFDNEAHDAAAAMVKHRFLELNNKLYSFKADYKRDPTLMGKLSKGQFEVYDEEYASINRC